MDSITAPAPLLADLHEKHKARQARIKAAAIPTPPAPKPIPTTEIISIPNHFDIILREFCGYFEIRSEDVLSQRRLNYIADKRQLLAYMVYWLTDYTNPKIAARIQKDPSTVFYAIKKIQNNLPLHRKDIEALEARIKPLLPPKRKK